MGLLYWVNGLPLLAALVILCIPGIGKRVARGIAFAGVAASSVLLILIWARIHMNMSDYQFMISHAWFTFPNLWLGTNLTVGLAFAVDGLSLPLLSLAAIIVLLVITSVQTNSPRGKLYYFFILLTTGGIFSFFTAVDVFTLIAALEVVLFSTFFSILLFGHPDKRRGAALHFLIYRGLATVFLFVALLGLAYGAAGGLGPNVSTLPPVSSLTTSDAQTAAQQLVAAHVGLLTLNFPHMTTLMAKVPTSVFSLHWRMALFIVLLLAVLIEEAFVPFHTWFPVTTEAADTGTNMLLGGILTKTGAYLLIRFGVAYFPAQMHRAGIAIAMIGVVNIVYGGFAAWAQKEWKRLITYSTISHMGLVLIGIATMNGAGLQGAMFLLVSSGLLTALLFFVTSALEKRTNSLQLSDLGGLSKSMPILSGFLMVGALGSLGLPLTSGFISELQAFIGGFGAFPAITFVALLTMILSAVYLLYAMQKTTFGGDFTWQPDAIRSQLSIDAKALEYVPLIVFTGLVLLIGIYPDVIGNLFHTSAQALLRIGGK